MLAKKRPHLAKNRPYLAKRDHVISCFSCLAGLVAARGGHLRRGFIAGSQTGTVGETWLGFRRASAKRGPILRALHPDTARGGASDTTALALPYTRGAELARSAGKRYETLRFLLGMPAPRRRRQAPCGGA